MSVAGDRTNVTRSRKFRRSETERRYHTLRHCEEPLRRSNPDCLRGEILDCFVASAQNCFAILSLRSSQ
ncbi:hypothetical protein EAS62_07255 [Bradyrhizobium zhanjiangense]|uniref:Uncharacterized protein n=1 Tax=Bradyrhizobium zhanjiangense TaxID=1325107 RepID=A0ABY0DRI7_9BRAD|nr:hypothetical protein EAS62_07255 [Bradyrhizobium zhanjiangense]